MASAELSAVGLLAATLTSSGLLPQTARAIRSRHVDDLSPWMMLVIAAGTLLWLVYGIGIGDVIVAGANLAAAVGAFVLLALRGRLLRTGDGGG